MVVSEHAPSDVEALFETLSLYLPADRIPGVREAYEFALRCHEGQKRLSGEPYIIHPVAVAQLVAELRMDAPTITAALLHDVIEDCGIKSEEIARRFTADVAHLVDGATKIEHLPTPQPGVVTSVDAETLRKMFVAMAEDVRVVIIKIADRLHNMRTLEHLSPVRQQAIARETMDIYAPLAARLGIWQFKPELEDLAFSYLEPEEYRRVAEMVAARRTERERFVKRVEADLGAALEAAEVKAEISGRVKHLYSIAGKMKRYAADGKSFDQIHDLLALRVLVDTVGDCYNALGVVHQTWHPLPGGFDDYIANPKESLYQSLHTNVMGPNARPFEVQIRTYEMHELAEYGVAAHWQYKAEPRKRDHQYEERMSWLRHLIEWQQEASGTEDFLESVKTDIFRDQVFVYTPRAEVRVLPAGSTPIDFAYRVHTDLGNRCQGARVNGRLVPLTTKLQNGDIVEIVRGKADRGPSRDWMIPTLGFLGSSHSRQKVRQWFRKAERGENIARGRELFDRERKRLGITDIPSAFASQLGYEGFDDMLAAIGYGDVSHQQLVQRLAELAPPAPPPLPRTVERRRLNEPEGVRVLGEAGLHVLIGRCCTPLPGDGIIGYITRSRGVTVHRRDCHNVVGLRFEAERLVECDWGHSGELYSAAVLVHAWDRVGLLRDVATIVASDGVNMVGVRTQEHDDRTTTVHITLETSGRMQVSRLMSHLEGLRGIIAVSLAEI
ncbi:MAG: bifunctional (p)ppGpp synthetase/guanosine-3',5'-bis(diphosphate) 3'-pyrophosphohydrolase [Chloroflexi bacterium]|nr:MAG: bifunctional (p)ppGpp synthetase/guanosine-3',5'-bis(diphosphate) 3'-pyrophosphohydrolase [Chloroflexota bacterium]